MQGKGLLERAHSKDVSRPVIHVALIGILEVIDRTWTQMDCCVVISRFDKCDISNDSHFTPVEQEVVIIRLKKADARDILAVWRFALRNRSHPLVKAVTASFQSRLHVRSVLSTLPHKSHPRINYAKINQSQLMQKNDA